jgi:hypothetical protein
LDHSPASGNILFNQGALLAIAGILSSGRGLQKAKRQLLEESEQRRLRECATQELVPILGGNIKATTAPHQDRHLDHSDCAFWRVPDDVVEDLGAANFLGALSLSHNRAPLERRYFRALGYAVSRNRDGVDHVQRSIAIIPSMHTSNAVPEPALAKKLRASGDEHILGSEAQWNRKPG